MEGEGIRPSLVVPGSARKEISRMVAGVAAAGKVKLFPVGGTWQMWGKRRWEIKLVTSNRPRVKAEAVPRFKSKWITLSSVILRVF